MTTQARIRRLGWLAMLGLCTALYLLLHLKVHAVKSDVIRSERQIVRLEQEKVLLETEFESRANLLQLSAWNQVDFGYTAPTASQFIESQRQLASFGTPRAPSAPAPIRVARSDGDGSAIPDFPKLVSPLTGKPVDEALLAPARAQLSAQDRTGATRISLGAVIESGTE
ncbi:MAG: hypothetical protein ABIP41_07675 [Croceibacterium sp.]